MKMLWKPRWISRVCVAAAVSILTACGGGGGAGTPLNGGGSSSTVTASDIILTAAPSATILNSTSNSVTITAMAVDSNRNALASIPVTFSVDSNALITPSATATSSGGTITGVLKIGADQSDRAIHVQATSGSITRTLTVMVSGSQVTATAYASTVSAGSTGNQVTFRLTDNTGAKMSGYAYSVNGVGGVQSGTTDSDGQFVYSYTAPSTAGTVSITAQAAGVSQTVSVTVNAGAASVPVVTPDSVKSASLAASPSVLAVNTSGSSTNKSEVRALFLGDGNRPVQNVRVWFDLNGDPSNVGGTLTSTAAGTLMYSDANGIARTNYVAGSRSSPKDGVQVRVCWDYADFDPASACPNQALAYLTVSSETLSVSIGTDGKLVANDTNLSYEIHYVVSVADAAGQAKAGVTISPSLDLVGYFLGQFVASGGRWVQAGTGALDAAGDYYYTAISADLATTPRATYCANEDLNRNGVVETNLLAKDIYVPWGPNGTKYLAALSRSEDQNESGNALTGSPALDPHKAAVLVSAVNGTFVTNSDGVVVLKISFARNVAGWIRYNLVVSASGVAGTEGRANYEDTLPVDAAAANDTDADPPFKYSPYGVGMPGGTPVIQRENTTGQKANLCVVCSEGSTTPACVNATASSLSARNRSSLGRR